MPAIRLAESRAAGGRSRARSKASRSGSWLAIRGDGARFGTWNFGSLGSPAKMNGWVDGPR